MKHFPESDSYTIVQVQTTPVADRPVTVWLLENGAFLRDQFKKNMLLHYTTRLHKGLQVTPNGLQNILWDNK